MVLELGAISEGHTDPPADPKDRQRCGCASPARCGREAPGVRRVLAPLFAKTLCVKEPESCIRTEDLDLRKSPGVKSLSPVSSFRRGHRKCDPTAVLED